MLPFSSLCLPYCRTKPAVEFTCRYWLYSVYVSAFYVVSIFAIKRWMRDRERFNLRRPLFAWSLSLCLFSCLGAYGLTLPQFQVAWENGFHYSVCQRTEGRVVNIWMFMMSVSKLLELTDTYFIVLRKQKLIFLHWYHHITVFMYCSLQYCQLYPPGQWFSAMNYFVHAIMYGYYAVRASGLYRPPIWINMFITVLQLIQMLAGVAITLYVYYHVLNKTWDCGEGYDPLLQVYLSLGMYFSYLVLFANFFYSTYFSKPSPPRGGRQPVAPSQAEPPVANEVIPSFSKTNGINSKGLSQNNVRHR